MDDKAKTENYIKGFDNVIEHFAFMRRMAETDGCNMTYLDEKINELCTKWHNKYAEMSQAQLAVKGMMDIIKAGHGEDLLRDLFDMSEE